MHLLSYLWLINQILQIIPVNNNGIKIYDISLTERAQCQGHGSGNYVGMVCQIAGLFRLDMNIAGRRCPPRG